jgi:DNA-binding transcriptional ArsR family regulator
LNAEIYGLSMALGPGPVLEETAARFALLGDPTRLHLLSVILDRGECSVGELAAATNISVANASQHLRKLTVGGVLGRRRNGHQIYYRVVEATIAQLCETVCASVRERAGILAQSPVG